MSARRTQSEWLLAALTIAFGIVLTMVFFGPLWTNGGLIGGDTLTYFFPQKQFLAEQLREGHIPLWNNRSGFGYPLVAESQTGVLYPPNWILYPLWDVETAYITGQLAHYVAAFLLTWLYARRIGLSLFSAWLVGLVFVYGWFPPRLCLEWAIIGGCYLPGVLWCVEGWLQQANKRWLVGAWVLLGLQMLAGHFHLAFITQLTLLCYVPLRLWIATESVVVGRGIAESSRSKLMDRLRPLGLVGLTLLAGYAFAAAQLMPTFELKQHSQRQTASSRDFDPAYGSIPPLYVTQVVGSWLFWYSPDVDRDAALSRMQKVSATNQVEAHLYFGLIPFGLLIGMLLFPRFRQAGLRRFDMLWLLLGGLALLYATGCLMPIARHLPGFSFFRGPGRYGIVTTLAVAVVAGRVWQLVVANFRPKVQWLLTLSLLAFTIYDLQLVPQQVTYVNMLSRRQTQRLPQSEVGELLRQHRSNVRLFAPGPNLTNLLGVSSVPEYLGLGPAEYYDPATKAPEFERLTPEFCTWAERSGITHVLTFEPQVLDELEDRVRLVSDRPDSYLNSAWAKNGRAPLFLYELTRTRGRVWIVDPSSKVLSASSGSIGQSANEYRCEVEAAVGTRVVLTDLDYPGWVVSVDGQTVEGVRHENLFRAVDVTVGRHEIVWSFRPWSVRVGAIISVLAMFGFLAVFVVGKRREAVC